MHTTGTTQRECLELYIYPVVVFISPVGRKRLRSRMAVSSVMWAELRHIPSLDLKGRSDKKPHGIKKTWLFLCLRGSSYDTLHVPDGRKGPGTVLALVKA